MKLIDADPIYDKLMNFSLETTVSTADTVEARMQKVVNDIVNYYKATILKAPTVDAAPVIRCINCENFERTYELGGFCLFWPHNGDRPAEVDIDDFCSYGSEKDLEDNA